MMFLRHPTFLLRVWLNTHSAAKLQVINCEDESPALRWAPSAPEHPLDSTQALLSSLLPLLQSKEKHICKTMGVHGRVRAAEYRVKRGMRKEDPGRNHRSRSSTRVNWSGLIDFALPWLGYASCAVFPEIGIHMSGSMRAGCPSSV